MPRNVKRHVYVTHLGHKDYKCGDCQQSFGSKQVLERHCKNLGHNLESMSYEKSEGSSSIIVKKVESEDLQSKIELKNVNTSFRNAIIDNSDDGSYSINVDEKMLKMLKDGKSLYKCDYCEKTFLHARNIKRHIQTSHEGRRDFKCGDCQQSFSSKQVLERHCQSSGHKIESMITLQSPKKAGRPKIEKIFKSDGSSSIMVNSDNSVENEDLHSKRSPNQEYDVISEKDINTITNLSMNNDVMNQIAAIKVEIDEDINNVQQVRKHWAKSISLSLLLLKFIFKLLFSLQEEIVPTSNAINKDGTTLPQIKIEAPEPEKSESTTTSSSNTNSNLQKQLLYYCDKCDFSTPNRISLENHQDSEQYAINKKNSCHLCDFISCTSIGLSVHHDKQHFHITPMELELQEKLRQNEKHKQEMETAKFDAQENSEDLITEQVSGLFQKFSQLCILILFYFLSTGRKKYQN